MRSKSDGWLERPVEALFRTSAGGALRFARPRAVLVAHEPAGVLPLLREVELATDGGAWAAGFVTYEASPGIDPALTARPPGPLPLAWFGIFDAPRHLTWDEALEACP